MREGWNTFEAQHMKKETVCIGCGAELPIAVKHASVSIKCRFCQPVNQVMPETAGALYQMGGLRSAAAVAALPLRHELMEPAVGAAAGTIRLLAKAVEPVESLDRWEAMERASARCRS